MGSLLTKIFHAANLYLGEKLSSSSQRVKANKAEKETGLQVTTDKNQELVGVYNGVKLKWVLFSSLNYKSVSDKKNTSS